MAIRMQVAWDALLAAPQPIKNSGVFFQLNQRLQFGPDLWPVQHRPLACNDPIDIQPVLGPISERLMHDQIIGATRQEILLVADRVAARPLDRPPARRRPGGRGQP
jgi:hypothetical protein